MKGFPGKVLIGAKKHGGLGLETPMMHAQKRKLRIVMMGLAKGGLTGAHIENLIRIELEKSGRGGLPNQGLTISVMCGNTGYITSLVEWLMRLNLPYIYLV